MIGITAKDLIRGQKRRSKDKTRQEESKATLTAAKARFKRAPYYCTCNAERGKRGNMAD